jgi:hypothetical protein
MKAFIAILSCIPHAKNGCNQAMRDTWLKYTEGIEYRFFLGDGTIPSEDTSLLEKTWREEHHLYTQSKFSNEHLNEYIAKSDEIVLNVSDRYEHMSLKLKKALRWILYQNFDFVFVCLTDTYVSVERLLHSGFEYRDYLGTSNGERTAIGGGPGTWFSRRAIEYLVDSPITNWAYDKWAGEVMFEKGIPLTHDDRYTNLDLGDDPPLAGNTTITSHIANRSRTVYKPEMMIELHERCKETQCTK